MKLLTICILALALAAAGCEGHPPKPKTAAAQSHA
jgi:hypothetical protein